MAIFYYLSAIVFAIAHPPLLPYDNRLIATANRKKLTIYSHLTI